MTSLLEDDSHVETRISQYESLKNGKGLTVAKEIVLAKARGYSEVLKKYGLRSLDYCTLVESVKGLKGDLDEVRNRLMSIEGKFSQQYFNQMFGVFKESLRPQSRKTYKAYDKINNVLNLSYSVLFWKLQLAVHKSKLEPFLGFLHSLQWGMPSLILDLQDCYRYIADDFVIQYARKVKDRDFILCMDNYAGRKTKREFLNSVKRKEFLDSFDAHFDTVIEIPRVRRGRKQQIETLIGEEVLLLAQYLRNERQTWVPRTASLTR